MKRTLSAVAVAAVTFAAVPAHAVQPSFVDFDAPAAAETSYRTVSAQNLPQPSFVDFTILTTEATQIVADSNAIAGLPQPSSNAN